jgi:hypothetical protein
MILHYLALSYLIQSHLILFILLYFILVRFTEIKEIVRTLHFPRITYTLKHGVTGSESPFK